MSNKCGHAHSHKQHSNSLLLWSALSKIGVVFVKVALTKTKTCQKPERIETESRLRPWLLKTKSRPEPVFDTL